MASDASSIWHRSQAIACPRAQQTIQTLSDDVIGILDKLAIDKAVHIGQDIGATIAAHVATTKSDRIIASIWIEPPYRSKEFLEKIQSKIADAEKGGMSQVAATATQSEVWPTADVLAKPKIMGTILAQDPRSFIANCRVLVEAEMFSLPEAEIPLMVVMRTKGDELSKGTMEIFQAVMELPMDHFTSIFFMKGSGEWVCLQQPDLMTKRILAFLEKVLKTRLVCWKDGYVVYNGKARAAYLA